jgi:hypothetical protein
VFRETLNFVCARTEGSKADNRNVVSGIGARLLGSTGLTVSRIGLGLAALGRPAYINLRRDQDYGHERTVAAMEQRCHEMLDAAYDRTDWRNRFWEPGWAPDGSRAMR